MDDPTPDDTAKRTRSRRFHRVADSLGTLGSAERVRVLLLLADGERGVGEIRAELGTTQPATSYHLRLLRQSGILRFRRRGGFAFYALTEKGTHAAEYGEYEYEWKPRPVEPQAATETSPKTKKSR